MTTITILRPTGRRGGVMATTAVEISNRSPRENWGEAAQRERRFQAELPAVIFEAVSQLAREHGVVLRSVQVIERKSKAR